MIIFVQFPITDIREFLPVDTGILTKPSWPSPKVGKQFVRYFGPVKKRKSGGAPGWVGENEICDSHNALKLDPRIAPFSSSRGDIKIICADRHFFFDGTAVGKYVLVLITKPAKIQLEKGEFEKLLNYILGLPVFIRFPNKETVKSDLYSIKGQLSKFYLLASSDTHSKTGLEDKKWTIAGEPLLFLELSVKESIKQNANIKVVDLVEKCGLTISQQWINRGSTQVQVFTAQHNDPTDVTRENGRILRMYLMRLHAEFESIRDVSTQILDGVIAPERGTPESDKLQNYLDKTIENINKNVGKTISRSENTDLTDLAYLTMDRLNPGTRDSLMSMLRSKQIRPQIIHNVETMFVKSAEIKSAEKLFAETAEIERADNVTIHEYQPQTWEKLVVYLAGLLFIGLIGYLVIRNEPIADPNLVVFIRVILSTLMAAMGATIPGMLKVGLDKKGFAIRASGALALFVLSYLFTPKVI